MRFVLMHVSTHSRGKGHSSVAAAAYRLGVKLRDERTGIAYDYARKGVDGVAASVHVVPDNAAEELRDVSSCWNAAEAAENRKDSQVCRDFRESVPLGLDEAAATSMMHDWASYLSNRYNTPITAALHRDNARDVTGRMKDEEQRGFHIHGLMPTRALGEDGHLGPKLNQLSNSRLSSIEIEQCRSDWSKLCNDYAQRYGLNQTYTHLSHERLGDGLEAQVTLGVAASAMERRGVETDKGNALREQKAEQELRAKQEREREEKAQAQARRKAEMKELEVWFQQQREQMTQQKKAWEGWQTTVKAAAENLKNHDQQVKQMREKEAETLRAIEAEQQRAKQQMEAWADRYGEHNERAKNYAASFQRSTAAASEAAETARTSMPLPGFLGRKRREALETQRRENTRAGDYKKQQEQEQAKAKHAAEQRDEWGEKLAQAKAQERAERQRQQAAEQQRAQQRAELVAQPKEAWKQLTPEQQQQAKAHAAELDRQRQEAEQRRLQQQEEQERQRQQAEQRQQMAMTMQPPVERQRSRMRM